MSFSGIELSPLLQRVANEMSEYNKKQKIIEQEEKIQYDNARNPYGTFGTYNDSYINYKTSDGSSFYRSSVNDGIFN